VTETWDLPVRTALFFAIYTHVFLHRTDIIKDAEWDFIQLFLPESQSHFSKEEVDVSYQSFLSKEGLYQKELQQFLHDWQKTYDLVKALFFTLLTELDLYQDSSVDHKNLFNRYLRLAQDYIGGENVGLVHAIMIKLFESRGLELNHTEINTDKKENA